MTASEIRQQFLQFFQSKGHKIVTSAPIVVKNDPTLMFTNAGMNQFKDFFLGNKKAENKRVANSQRCLRVSGKHNDLEEVGHDTYHHTMFEMLGNWSFGDYFKSEAIEWSWELLTKIYKLDPSRLYITIFEGDNNENLEKDTEAYNEWKKWVPEKRILNGNKKDNFWEMGEAGPCGPCSEIHIDLRSDEERKIISGDSLVNKDHPQVVEIWNLVFMEFNRKADGSLELLPDKHVDTGMGFERLCMAIQSKKSNYDTDVFSGLINKVCSLSGNSYGTNPKKDIAARVIADHVRAVSFAIADGQIPSNTGAGYVIRRILRRAVRYGYSYLSFNKPFVNELVNDLALQFKDVFPEISQQQSFITKVIEEEEISFLRTLENGIQRFDNINGQVTGKQAFELYDTYGFPLDLTQLLASEKNILVDVEGFQYCLEEQKKRSRKASEITTDDWIEVRNVEINEFVGYDTFEAQCFITKYRKIKSDKKSFFQIVLNKTPFYAESGGQVGDTGFLESSNEKIFIFDTKKENELIVHYSEHLPENFESEFTAKIHVENRRLSQRNHSATHLLHSALKQVLGNHVQQKGSLVNPDILRFDFSHFSKLDDSQIIEIEEIVNGKIREPINLDEKRSVPISKAKDMGATALFGEKYGDNVRVITFDKHYSMELCGGTHVKNTAEIGTFKIIYESSISAGIRRIEAITSVKADKYVVELQNQLKEIKEILKHPKNISSAIQQIIEENSLLKKKIEQLEVGSIQIIKDELLKNVEKIDSVNFITKKITISSASALKQLAFDLRKEVDMLFLVIAANIDGTPNITIMLSDKVRDMGYKANEMVKILGKEISGGGGGQDFYATAGGKDISGLDCVVKKSRELLLSLKQNDEY